MTSIKHLLSRYGGHSILFGYGKSSGLLLPENQSFENIMEQNGVKMNGFTYLTSYQIQTDFMGSFDRLPIGYCTKIIDLEHIFLEILTTYDEYVNTSVYFTKTVYGNVFSLFIKTDFSPLQLSLGKIKSSYDCVLYLQIENKDEFYKKDNLQRIMHVMIILLIYHMDIINTEFKLLPSKTYLGKMLDCSKITQLINEINSCSENQDLKNILII